jgi:hypothetical protein
MKIVATSVILLAGFFSSAEASDVTILFVHPEAYTDAAENGEYGLDAQRTTLDEVARYLDELGRRYLLPEQALAIQVLDVDLAGQYEPWRRDAYNVRIYRDVYPPRITMRYQFTDVNGDVLDREEVVSDIDYLSNPRARFTHAPLRYEKPMLENWFRRQFGDRRSRPA